VQCAQCLRSVHRCTLCTLCTGVTAVCSTGKLPMESKSNHANYKSSRRRSHMCKGPQHACTRGYHRASGQLQPQMADSESKLWNIRRHCPYHDSMTRSSSLDNSMVTQNSKFHVPIDGSLQLFCIYLLLTQVATTRKHFWIHF
jgi:hypothetical protein